MKVTEWKDKATWNHFVAAQSVGPASFLQSWEWGEFQKSQGNEVWRLGLQPSGVKDYEREGLLAVAGIIRRCLPLPKMCFLYLPRGPILRQDNTNSQEPVIKALVEYIGQNSHIFLRVIPPWTKEKNKTAWEQIGFANPMVLTRQREPECTLLTSLDQPEKMLSGMHPKTRYNINLAERRGVSVRCYEREADLDIFWGLLNATASREKIRLYKKDYYTELMLKTNQLTDLRTKPDFFQLRSILGLASYQGEPLAGGLWLVFGDTLTYLHGGSSREHKEVMAPYGLHWAMMRWGVEQGLRYYDWWGVEKPGGVFHLGGVSRFKRGFSGQEQDLVGVYDYICNKNLFKYLTWLKRIKEIF